MATFGQIAEFNATVEPWIQYTERLQQFFIANAIQEPERCRAIFLTVVGPSTYGLLKNLLSPAQPVDRTLQELLDVLSAHFEPAPSEIVERFKFNSRVRKPGESVSNFIAELRCLAKFCSYGDSLDMMLRDRVVCGIQDDAIQRKLLSETRLTLGRATEIAIAMETAAKNSVDLKLSSFAEVCAVRQKQTMPQSSDTPRSPKAYSNKFAGTKAMCFRCGDPSHFSAKCRFIGAKCNACGKIGHLARICQSSKMSHKEGKTTRRVDNVQEQFSQEDSGKELGNVNSYDFSNHMHMVGKAPPPIVINFQVEGNTLPLELDSGAPFSLITMETYRKLKKTLPALKETDIRLRSYTKHEIETVGILNVEVLHRSCLRKLPLLVVKEGAINLAGRNWIEAFSLISSDCVSAVSVACGEDALQSVLSKYRELFSPGLGLIKDVKVHLTLRSSAVPKFYKARPVPYALRKKVDEELDRLVQEGIIEPIKTSVWAAPLVPVLKPDGRVRLCGDFKLTVNPATELEQYPLPNVDDLFAQLSGGLEFSKVDLRDAYCQLELDEESKVLVVVNTHRGLFRYNRLPFGVASAPAIFQREMDKILGAQKGASCYLDDLLTTGSSKEEHLTNLNRVLEKLQSAGAKLHTSKCDFMRPSVEYLGHRIDKAGLHPIETKMQAIENAPLPKSVEELRSFLGLLSYYSKFLPNMSTLLSPLYKLLRHNESWHWGKEQTKAFIDAKNTLLSSSLLVHFDNDREVVLACDASPVGVGAVLSHSTSSGDRPIAFASRSLTVTEQKYSQIEKEALALVFGVVRFRKYLLGREFILLTDHQPLVSLLSESKPVPTIAAARILRWALVLSAYTYKIKFRKGSAHANADACSRLVLPTQGEGNSAKPTELVLLLETLDDTPVTSQMIRTEIEASPVLDQVKENIQHGWPKQVSTELQSFWVCRNELSLEEGVILRGSRVFIPLKFRRYVLDELHMGHQGMTTLKAMARDTVWWPGMDRDVEELVRNCHVCQMNASMPPSKQSPWPHTKKVWDRIHIDHAGPFENKTLLVVVDAGSKWLEVIQVASTASAHTIAALQSLFSRYGLPRVIVSDNGTSFTSSEFVMFMVKNGITHVRTAPYHPQSNGLAERAVRTVKTALRKITEGSMKDRLENFLFNYRRAPSATTGVSPAMSFYGRPMRGRLDLLRPESAGEEHSTFQSGTAPFQRGDHVWARMFGIGPRWMQGTVVELMGRVMLRIHTAAGVVVRHFDQVRHSSSPPAIEPMQIQSELPVHVPQDRTVPQAPAVQELEDSIPPGVDQTATDLETLDIPFPGVGVPISTVPPVRRSTRERRAPVRLDL